MSTNDQIPNITTLSLRCQPFKMASLHHGPPRWLTRGIKLIVNFRPPKQFREYTLKVNRTNIEYQPWTTAHNKHPQYPNSSEDANELDKYCSKLLLLIFTNLFYTPGNENWFLKSLLKSFSIRSNISRCHKSKSLSCWLILWEITRSII